MKIEYRVWNPFRSKLAAAILGGVDKIHIKLGAASGTTVSHVADIVGPVSPLAVCVCVCVCVCMHQCTINGPKILCECLLTAPVYCACDNKYMYIANLGRFYQKL